MLFPWRVEPRVEPPVSGLGFRLMHAHQQQREAGAAKNPWGDTARPERIHPRFAVCPQYDEIGFTSNAVCAMTAAGEPRLTEAVTRQPLCLKPRYMAVQIFLRALFGHVQQRGHRAGQ